MNHRERFYATIERRHVDRPACWLGLPVPEAYQGLMDYFRVSSIDELKLLIDDDIYPIELPYHSPISDAIYMAFDFAKEGTVSDEQRTLTAPGFSEDYADPQLINDFDWPHPLKYIDPQECRAAANAAPPDDAVLGVVWSAHFQDACAAFGMETALIKMLTEPEMFRVVIDRITDFYPKANEVFYQATRGGSTPFSSATTLAVRPG